MGRKDQQEKKEKNQKIKEENKKIKYKSGTEDDGSFFKKLKYIIAIGVLVSIALNNLFDMDFSGSDVAEEPTESDKKGAHRDVFKYQKEVLHDEDPEFSTDLETSKEIVAHF